MTGLKRSVSLNNTGSPILYVSLGAGNGRQGGDELCDISAHRDLRGTDFGVEEVHKPRTSIDVQQDVASDEVPVRDAGAMHKSNLFPQLMKGLVGQCLGRKLAEVPTGDLLEDHYRGRPISASEDNPRDSDTGTACGHNDRRLMVGRSRQAGERRDVALLS